jgi:hypothetical protein
MIGPQRQIVLPGLRFVEPSQCQRARERIYIPALPVSHELVTTIS